MREGGSEEEGIIEEGTGIKRKEVKDGGRGR